MAMGKNKSRPAQRKDNATNIAMLIIIPSDGGRSIVSTLLYYPTPSLMAEPTLYMVKCWRLIGSNTLLLVLYSHYSISGLFSVRTTVSMQIP